MLLVNYLRQYGIYIAFVLICIVISVLSPQFLSASNWSIIITQVSINALLAFGVTFVIISGGIDLSLGSIVAVSGVLTAMLAHSEGLPLIAPILAGLISGSLLGLFNGFIITKSKIAPFIVTLGTMTIARGLALIFSKGRPISNLSDSFNFIGGGSFLGLPIPIYIFVFVFIICYILLNKTVLGRYIYAVGGNQEASRAAGINVNAVKISVYTIAGLLSGLAGVVLTSRITTGQPNAGAGFELDAIAAAVIGGTSTSGGKGTITGTLIGVLLIGVINNGLDLLNVSSYYQQVVMGLIIIGAVILDSLNQNNE
jgi:ribose/xylose/arabinose/galactoside ABC-type transport system permease subunit